jgi:hypothetical protein
MPTKMLSRREKQEKDKKELGDLSRRLECYLDKKPGQTIRVKRVIGDQYRANWHEPDTSNDKGVKISTFKIVESKFLTVTPEGSQLKIVDSTISRKKEIVSR